MIDANTPIGLSAANTPSGSETSSAQLKESYNSFLTLLTAQISNQDPLKPVDSTQFVSQLAQLSQVEQGISMNANLESISGMLSSMGAMSDLQLIGRDLLVPSNQVRMTGSEFPFSYQLEEGASDVKIRIFATDGTLVRELDGPSTAAGELIDVEWDRRDNVGLNVPDEMFRVEVSATDVNGEPVGVTGLTTAGVEQLNFTARGPVLLLSNGETVLSQAIRAVF